PRSTSSARARPVAGQITDTCGATTANSRPSRAVAKYTKAAPSTSSANGGRPALEVVAAGMNRLLLPPARCYGTAGPHDNGPLASLPWQPLVQERGSRVTAVRDSGGARFHLHTVAVERLLGRAQGTQGRQDVLGGGKPVLARLGEQPQQHRLMMGQR